MTRYIYKFTFLIVILGISLSVNGQTPIRTNIEQIPLTYKEFLQNMATSNLMYAQQRFNIDIAEAEFQASKILPDPSLSFGYFDNQERTMKLGYGFEADLEWELEFGGKRKARKNLANDQRELTVLELNEFFQDLRAQGTVAYLEGLQNRMIFDIQKSSFESMNKVAISDSIRFGLGQISEIDAVQSKLEAQSVFKDLQDAQQEFENSVLEISALMGDSSLVASFLPEGEFKGFERLFDLQELMIIARENKADLLVARQNIQVASKQVRLAKAERAIDLGISVGVEYNAEAKNEEAPTPSFTAVKAGVSIPLKFSNKRNSDYKIAMYQQKQADIAYKQVEVELDKQIRQAYNNYLNKQKQIIQFEHGMLSNAKRVFVGITYSYQRGASSLLEVLDAQRTYNEVQLAYAQTLFEYATSLVILEHAVGIWDIDF